MRPVLSAAATRSRYDPDEALVADTIGRFASSFASASHPATFLPLASYNPNAAATVGVGPAPSAMTTILSCVGDVPRNANAAARSGRSTCESKSRSRVRGASFDCAGDGFDADSSFDTTNPGRVRIVRPGRLAFTEIAC